jgi:hypothetical protein
MKQQTKEKCTQNVQCKKDHTKIKAKQNKTKQNKTKQRKAK